MPQGSAAPACAGKCDDACAATRPGGERSMSKGFLWATAVAAGGVLMSVAAAAHMLVAADAEAVLAAVDSGVALVAVVVAEAAESASALEVAAVADALDAAWAGGDSTA